MDGEELKDGGVEYDAHRRNAAAYATLWLDWIVGGSLREAMGPSVQPRVEAVNGHADPQQQSACRLEHITGEE